MKTDKITVNKTPELPDGVDINIVQPEDDLQSGVLSYLLGSAIREADRNGKLNFELPERFNVRHRSDGTFVITTASGGDSPLYEPPRPIAIIGIAAKGRRFDLIHAELKPENFQNQPVTPPAQDSADDDSDESADPQPAAADQAAEA
jgi:hypothetical protein